MSGPVRDPPHLAFRESWTIQCREVGISCFPSVSCPPVSSPPLVLLTPKTLFRIHSTTPKADSTRCAHCRRGVRVRTGTGRWPSRRKSSRDAVRQSRDDPRADEPLPDPGVSPPRAPTFRLRAFRRVSQPSPVGYPRAAHGRVPTLDPGEHWGCPGWGKSIQRFHKSRLQSKQRAHDASHWGLPRWWSKYSRDRIPKQHWYACPAFQPTLFVHVRAASAKRVRASFLRRGASFRAERAAGGKALKSFSQEPKHGQVLRHASREDAGCAGTGS